MLLNYLKIALRNITRQKGYSFINISGLALGMTCSIFLLLWIQDELSYNRFHANANNLYRVENNQWSPEGIFHVNLTPDPMGAALQQEIPEIKNVARGRRAGSLLVQYGLKTFYENNALAADPSFLRMFSFPLIDGKSETALNQPNSIVIDEDIAQKYFGGEDPIGKTIIVNSKYAYTVTGVMKTIPFNSTIRPSIIVSYEITKQLGIFSETWGLNNTVTWVELSDASDSRSVSKKISEIHLKNVGHLFSNPQERKQHELHPNQFSLMRITDLRLFENFGYGKIVGSYYTVLVFLAMAIFILLIACINFMNLATARSANRAKEIGLRKTVGAGRLNIALQFYGESVLMTGISLLFSLLLVELLLPVFNTISEKHFTSLSPFSLGFIPYIVGIAFLTGIISGTYPAFFLSRFQPIQILKGRLKSGSKSAHFRKILVVVQFSLSIILMIGTLVIYQQMQFMREMKLGYDKDHLMYMPLRGETSKSYPTLKQELLKDSRILGVSGSYQIPTSFSANSGGADWDGKDPNSRPLIGYGFVDFDYVETMKIELAEGRSFSETYATDTSNAVLINEEVVKLMGGKSVVGKRFDFGSSRCIIIGVMKNFHYQQVQNNIEPIALYVSPGALKYAIIRLQAQNVMGSIDAVKAAWQKVNPLFPFEYTFFDQDFSESFRTEEKIGTIFQYAAIFAIMIACLGLFGLASYMVEQRTKEVGIRKVLGASTPGIAVMLSKEFIRWILIANIIAAPVTYYLMDMLLMNYAYRISIAWWLFAVAAILTLTIALMTISYQSIKAARSNPVDSLKYE